MGAGKKVVVEPHRHAGVFIARGKEDALVTKNMVMGESVYGEKRIATEDEAGKVGLIVGNFANSSGQPHTCWSCPPKILRDNLACLRSMMLHVSSIIKCPYSKFEIFSLVSLIF